MTGRRTAGIDIGGRHDYSTCCLVDDGRIVGAHRVRLGVSWRDQVATLVHLTRGCALVAVDATGVGAPVAEALRCHGVPVLPFTFTAASKPHLLADLAEAIHGRLLTMAADAPGAADLREELARFTAAPTRTGVRLSGKAAGGDDLVMGLALAVHAALALAHRAAQPPQASHIRGGLTESY
jgi:hypothetical protein